VTAPLAPLSGVASAATASTASPTLPATDPEPPPPTPSSGSPHFPTNKQIEVPVFNRGAVFHGPDAAAWVESMRRVITSSDGGGSADAGQPGWHQLAPRLGVPRRRGQHRGPARRWQRHELLQF
jgi:hypothetical protein